MNISNKLLIYFLLFSYSQFQPHPTEPVLLVDEITTSDELHGALQSQKECVIKLYSQHCPYCNMFSKTFNDYAKKYRSMNFMSADGKKLNAPKIVGDITNNTLKIPGYPSVLYVKNGTIIDYQIGGNPKVFAEKIEKLRK